MIQSQKKTETEKKAEANNTDKIITKKLEMKAEVKYTDKINKKIKMKIKKSNCPVLTSKV